MRAPLPSGPPTSDGMKPVLTHNEGAYRFELFPDMSCLVFKDGQASYSIRPEAEGGCECPGYKHRGSCKHWRQYEAMVLASMRKEWK